MMYRTLIALFATTVFSGTAGAALTGHFVSDDWTGSGPWINRVAGNTDATIASGTPTLVAAGASASQAGVNFIDFDGSSFFNVASNTAANPMFGLTDYAITAVFTANGNAQTGATDNNWWAHAGLVGNELPGGFRSDAGLTIDDTIGSAALSDTRRYTADAPQTTGNIRTSGSVVDTSMHVMTMTRVITAGAPDTADLALWLDGSLVGTATGRSNGSNFLVTNAIETDASGDAGFSDGFAIGGVATNASVAHPFHGYIAEVQIDNDGGLDVAALHSSLVQGGVYQAQSTVPEPSSVVMAALGLLGLAVLLRRRR